jgi:hypothetical protein
MKDIKSYVLYDTKNNVYLKSKRHYGYTENDETVFSADFTEDKNLAIKLDEVSANKMIGYFSSYKFLSKFSIDSKLLKIIEL